MIKEELTGFIKSVGEIEFVGANQTPKQQIILHIPGYTYQDRVIEDEHWRIDVIGNAVERHNIRPESEGERAKVTFWLKSKEYIKDGKASYFTNANLADLKWMPIEKPTNS